jgi:hypothetical protein
MEVFTDDQCTQPTYVSWRHDEGTSIWPCMAYKPFAYAWDYDNRQVRVIRDVHPEPLYSTLSGSCGLLDIINATPYALGPAISIVIPRATMRFE